MRSIASLTATPTTETSTEHDEEHDPERMARVVLRGERHVVAGKAMVGEEPDAEYRGAAAPISSIAIARRRSGTAISQTPAATAAAASAERE